MARLCCPGSAFEVGRSCGEAEGWAEEDEDCFREALEVSTVVCLEGIRGFGGLRGPGAGASRTP